MTRVVKDKWPGSFLSEVKEGDLWASQIYMMFIIARVDSSPPEYRTEETWRVLVSNADGLFKAKEQWFQNVTASTLREQYELISRLHT